METITSLEQLTTVDAIRQCLEGTQNVAFSVKTTKQNRYRRVQKALVKHQYIRLNTADKGCVTRYLIKVTDYSRAQVKRLIQKCVKSGTITVKRAPGNGFQRACTDADIRLLASGMASPVVRYSRSCVNGLVNALARQPVSDWPISRSHICTTCVVPKRTRGSAAH